MQVQKIPFQDTKQFNSLFLDYLGGKKLKDFYQNPPTPEGIKAQLKIRKFDEEKRSLLKEVLLEQYEKHAPPEIVIENIHKLTGDKTFTITTGHQLNLFTGPLYFHLKIITTINACKTLKELVPDYDFVPVFWMASEDHDFEEINHFHLIDQTFSWNTDQAGAVGRFETASIAELLKEIPGNDLPIKEAYRNYSNLADACRCYVNQLYGSQGLVIIDGDHKKLKASIKGVIRHDLFQNEVNEKVNQSSTELEKLGYKAQVFPREVNFFYMDDQIRNRIVKENNQYKVIDTTLKFSKSEIENLIEHEPWKFSPNALLRPIYQETVLPNLAVVGGPAEVAYWLQLKSSFELYDITFPVLLPRNFTLILTRNIRRKLSASGMSISDLFEDVEKLKTRWAKKVNPDQTNLESEKKNLDSIYTDLAIKAKSIDPTLEQMIEAETQKARNKLDRITKKFVRAIKRKQSDSISQIEEVKSFCFPNGVLQERYLNYLNFYFQNPDILDDLITKLDPFDLQFNILLDD